MLHVNILYFEVDVLDFTLLDYNVLRGKIMTLVQKMNLYQKFYHLLINETTNKLL